MATLYRNKPVEKEQVIREGFYRIHTNDGLVYDASEMKKKFFSKEVDEIISDIDLTKDRLDSFLVDNPDENPALTEENERYKNYFSQAIDLDVASAAWKKSIFNSTMRVFEEYGVEVKDVEAIYSFTLHILDQMKQQLIATRVLGIAPEDYIPGADYSGKMSMETLIRLNNETQQAGGAIDSTDKE